MYYNYILFNYILMICVFFIIYIYIYMRERERITNLMLKNMKMVYFEYLFNAIFLVSAMNDTM